MRMRRKPRCVTTWFYLTPNMQLGVLVLLLLTCFGAWLAAFVLECYRRDPQLGLEEHPLNQRPPFPGTTPDNLFWFLQVKAVPTYLHAP